MSDKPLTLTEARDAVSDHEEIAGLIGVASDCWGGRCHAISHALLRTGRVGPGRIARGWADGIRSQHSWIVLGDDCYDPEAVVVDPTFWPATDPAHRPLILAEYATFLPRAPHGTGDIFYADKPGAGDGPVIELTPRVPLSREADEFLQLLGPLDYKGWSMLAHGPMEGWPAGEIIDAICETRELKALVPIDIIGMVTDRNPGGLYR